MERSEGFGFLGMLIFLMLPVLPWVWVIAIVVFLLWGLLRVRRSPGAKDVTDRRAGIIRRVLATDQGAT